MNAGYGLSVRWSLENAPQDVAPKLRDYVVGTSMARFMFLDGLAFKTWRMVEGRWFEGTYVFDQAVYRDDFAADPAEPLDGLEFAAALRHQLQADADPEKRTAAGDDRLA